MEENYNKVKLAIDELLGVSSVIKRKKKTDADKKMEIFKQIITLMEEVQTRSYISHFDLNIDMTNYDEKFHQIIDALIYIAYGKQCYELISFYIYERINPEDQSINPVILDSGEEMMLTNPYELYNLMKMVNPKID